jgi:transcriptional regulator with XRE-family HTH domain
MFDQPRGPRPDPIDIAVGYRLRTLRKRRRVTQSALAASLGITFQQVQKYECAATRISASMLAKAASALGVQVAEFFPDQAEAVHENLLMNQLITSARGG